MKLRNNKQLYYLFENGYEIDFITEDNILIESKFHSEMNENQKKLFESYESNNKFVVNSVKALEILEQFEM